jgi:hypothetical protein
MIVAGLTNSLLQWWTTCVVLVVYNSITWWFGVIGLNRFPWRVPPKCRSMCYAVIYIIENGLMKSNDNTFNACDLSLSYFNQWCYGNIFRLFWIKYVVLVTLIKKTIQALIQRQLVNYYSFFIIFIIIALGLVMQSLDIVFRYFFIWAGQKKMWIFLLWIKVRNQSVSLLL